MKALACALAASLAAGPCAAETAFQLNFAFDQARALAKDHRQELFARAWVSAIVSPEASCAEALGAVRPLFVLAEDKALAESLAKRASARNLKVGEECRNLVVDSVAAELDEATLEAARPAQALSREGLLKSVDFPALLERQAAGSSGAKRRDPIYLASLAFVAGGNAFDIGTTMWAIDKGAVEANPVLAAFGNRNKPAIFAMNVGLQTGLTLFNHYFIYKKGRRKLASAINFIQGGIHGYAGVHNLRVVRGR